MSSRVYYGPPRDLAARPLRDFDDVVGIIEGAAVAESRAMRRELHSVPVVGELWQRVAERGETSSA